MNNATIRERARIMQTAATTKNLSPETRTVCDALALLAWKTLERRAAEARGMVVEVVRIRAIHRGTL